jgi:retron-type reverse transcriptase
MQDDPRQGAKPFDIPKRIVWNAWLHVAANDGAPGIDRESIEAYQARMGRNLYTLWNRMSSGSYHPQPVRQVLIPKADGGSRALGIPTVNDRVAQMAVKMILEPRLNPVFDPSSFGYRPGKSAHQALDQARRNCWRYDWVLDMEGMSQT